MNDLLNNFDLIDPIFILPTLINFLLCTLSSIVLREIYLKNSLTLSVKNYIGNILPVLSITIFLIILIVKSSIALSLGLVGALSIVRFRTPIKDPEELIFLFLSIAIGIGFGSGQTYITLIIIILIFIIIYVLNYLYKQKNIANEGYNCIINFENQFTNTEISNLLVEKCSYIKLIRSDVNENETTLVFNLIPKHENFLDEINNIFKNKSEKKFSISFFEESNW